MLYVTTPLDEFCKKWELEPIEYICHTCSETFMTTVPYRTNKSVGLASPQHECGENARAFLSRPTDPDDIEMWNQII